MNDPISLNCGGECCRRFTLPYSSYDILVAYCDAIRVKMGVFVGADGRHLWPIVGDIERLVEMLVPLGVQDWAPWDPGERLETPLHHYTCIHILASGLCAIYENRPSMCSKYPYGHECQYAKCQADKKGLPTDTGASLSKEAA